MCPTAPAPNIIPYVLHTLPIVFHRYLLLSFSITPSLLGALQKGAGRIVISKILVNHLQDDH